MKFLNKISFLCVVPLLLNGAAAKAAQIDNDWASTPVSRPTILTTLEADDAEVWIDPIRAALAIVPGDDGQPKIQINISKYCGIQSHCNEHLSGTTSVLSIDAVNNKIMLDKTPVGVIENGKIFLKGCKLTVRIIEVSETPPIHKAIVYIRSAIR